MLKTIITRIKQGHQTLKFPPKKEMPERFKGRPSVFPERCTGDCVGCKGLCPSNALMANPFAIDLGKCTLCGTCVTSCPNKAIEYTKNISMSARERKDMIIDGRGFKLAAAIDRKTKKLFGRSLKLRVVTAGSCSGCEMELNAVSNIQFDISRFGVQIVASPRHADGIIVTGPVTNNMKLALEKTYAAIAKPKLVIALGVCAISGGIFEGSEHANNGADSTVPVDLYIAGCPPHPYTIIDGILRILDRI